jgi:Carboxypeptidase regulatory-like domain
MNIGKQSGILLSIFGFALMATASGQNVPQGIETEKKSSAVTGVVTDQRGDPVPGAAITLIEPAGENPQPALADENGSFTFAANAGGFDLEVSAPGFATSTVHGVLGSNQQLDLGILSLTIQNATAEVRVTVSQQELAEEQVKTEENQRILGVIPNFYVTYNHDSVPLNAWQKYELAFRTLIDPETIGMDLLSSGVQQGTGGLKGYGNGSQGYAKRFAASYGTGAIDTLLGSAVLPSLFKQDPRYFYKGTGTIRQRALYAMSMSVLCKGDNGHWQYNYSGLLGGLAAGGLSNLYYPPANRNAPGMTFENTAIGIGSSALTNLLQEFLIRKFTRSAKQ